MSTRQIKGDLYQMKFMIMLLILTGYFPKKNEIFIPEGCSNTTSINDKIYRKRNETRVRRCYVSIISNTSQKREKLFATLATIRERYNILRDGKIERILTRKYSRKQNC